MRIFDIDIYRDGGSIKFRIERDGSTRQIWLNTPFAGEPRALRIDSVPASPGDPATAQLLADIEEWWSAIPPAKQHHIHEFAAGRGPQQDLDAEEMEAHNLSKVLIVRDYVMRNYSA